MGGSPGTSAEKVNPANPSLAGLQSQNTAQHSGSVQDLLNKYSSGQMSYNDAITAGKALGGTTVDPYADQRKSLQDKIKSLQTIGASGAIGGLFSDPNVGTNASSGLTKDLQAQLDKLPKPTENSTGMLDALRGAIATDPMAGSIYAKSQVAEDPTLRGLFNQGGLQDQAVGQYGTASSDLSGDRNALMGRDESYGLKDSDLAAYGQASGNIGRLFANQEQNLAQTLSDRGLGAAPSGVAGQAFSGLYGNKMEQLAQSQQQIAQNRINTAQQLAQARTNADLQRQSQAGALAGNLGSLGQSAISNQFNRQLAGSEDAYNKQAGAAGLTLQNQIAQQNANNVQFGQEQATKTPDFGTAIGNIATGAVGGLIGKGVDSLGGAIGKKIGV